MLEMENVCAVTTVNVITGWTRKIEIVSNAHTVPIHLSSLFAGKMAQICFAGWFPFLLVSC